MTPTIDLPLTLPCGTVLPNRIMKSSMSEALGTLDKRVTPALPTLYRRWAEGGAGLNVTGNVMIDRRAIGEPGNVVLEDDRDLPLLREWASGGSEHGTQLWMQLNHPGKQCPKGLNAYAVAPSAVPFGPQLAPFFTMPRALTEAEIEDLIARFAQSAALAQRAGFGGVQIHGAHGYLVSQFLSPHHNRRDDAWGGSLERRMRFVIEVYRAIRHAVGPQFPVGIKLNSADFQKGGFSEQDSIEVLMRLSELGMDLLEISGGTYEAPAMMVQKESTRAREAYFLEFAARARDRVKAPLAVTGGFRTATGIRDALASGALDVIGLARALAIDPDFPKKLLAGEDVVSPVKPIKTGIGLVDRAGLMEISWYARQLHRMGAGHAPKPDENPKFTLAAALATQGVKTLFTRLRA
jgi:2,4-dienoyl-CoA reductase-like NADH-dependent reductase (Old Yellow Enzyme family)